MDIYQQSLLTRRVSIPMIKMGGSIQKVILDALSEMEGKCGEERYIKRNSIRIFSHSCGMIKGSNVIIQVVFGCEVSNPVPDQEFECIVENNTRAGIKARLRVRGDSPFIVFLARDHHYMIPQFSDIKENEHIKVKVLGQRFEINDPKISVIATLLLDESNSTEDSTEDSDEHEGSLPPSIGGGMDVFVLTDSNSAKPLGRVKDEHVSNVNDYAKLDKHLNWRQQLSPLSLAQFSCNGSPEHGIIFKDGTWKSLEHFRHACKVYLHDPILALTFCMGGKNGDSAYKHLDSKYKHLTSHSKWDAIQSDVMLIGLTAQFKLYPYKMQILKDTVHAQLMCPVQGRLAYYETLREQ